MTGATIDADDVPLVALIGFTAGFIGPVVVLRTGFAVGRDDYEAGDGAVIRFVMSPAAAKDIGEALIEQAGRARAPRLV